MIHKDSTSKTLKRLDGTIADSDKDVDSNLTRIQNSRPHSGTTILRDSQRPEMRPRHYITAHWTTKILYKESKKIE